MIYANNDLDLGERWKSHHLDSKFFFKSIEPQEQHHIQIWRYHGATEGEGEASAELYAGKLSSLCCPKEMLIRLNSASLDSTMVFRPLYIEISRGTY